MEYLGFTLVQSGLKLTTQILQPIRDCPRSRDTHRAHLRPGPAEQYPGALLSPNPNYVQSWEPNDSLKTSKEKIMEAGDTGTYDLEQEGLHACPQTGARSVPAQQTPHDWH